MSAAASQELNAIIQKAFDHIKDLYQHVRQHELRLTELAQAVANAGSNATAAAPAPQATLAPVPTDRPIRVVFFVQTATEYWNSTESAWRAFASDPRCDTKIVLVPFAHPDYPAGRSILPHLIEQNIPFVRSEHYDVRRERPDVVFFQNPYDHTRPAPFHVTNVLPHVRRICYIPYGLEIGGGSNNLMLQFQKPLQIGAWRVFVRSERAKRLYALHCPAGNAQCVVTGHPKLDAVLATSPEQVDPELRAWAEGKRVVLWNAHFSVSKNDAYWSTFMKWKDIVLAYFESHPEVALLARPHPMLFKHVVSEKLMTEAEVAAFRARIDKSTNMRLDERGDYRHAFAVSSAMMSDTSSFLLEYPATGKPIAFLPNPKGAGLNEDGEVVDSYYNANTEEELVAFLDMVARGEDPRHDERMHRYAEFMFGIDGNVGNRIKEHVIDAARSGR